VQEERDSRHLILVLKKLLPRDRKSHENSQKYFHPLSLMLTNSDFPISTQLSFFSSGLMSSRHHFDVEKFLSKRTKGKSNFNVNQIRDSMRCNLAPMMSAKTI
jgi:hypothetical protein